MLGLPSLALTESSRLESSLREIHPQDLNIFIPVLTLRDVTLIVSQEIIDGKSRCFGSGPSRMFRFAEIGRKARKRRTRRWTEPVADTGDMSDLPGIIDESQTDSARYLGIP